MTDDFDSPALSASSEPIPELPGSYAHLRSLLAMLPAPTAPDIQSARQGAVSDQPAIGGFGAASSPLQGSSPGFDSGGEIGVLPQIFYGKSNALPDPMLWDVGQTNPIPNVATILGQWTCFYTLNSGALPATRLLFGSDWPVTDQANPLNTDAVLMEIAAFAGACDITVTMRSTNAIAGGAVTSFNAAYVLAAARVALLDASNLTNITSATVTVDVITVGNVIVASSTPFDLKNFISTAAFGDMKRLTAAWLNTAAGASRRWLLRLNIVASGAGGDVALSFGEPQLTLSSTESPPPFVPIVAAWVPQEIKAHRLANVTDVIDAKVVGDAQTRFELQVNGAHYWGSGAAVADARLRRFAAGVLRIDTFGAAASTNLNLESTAGQGNFLAMHVAADTNERVTLEGDATMAGAAFGPGNAAQDTRIRRSSAASLSIDDPTGLNQPTLIIDAGPAAGSEGGELVLTGAGANNTWHFDNFAGRLRWFVGASVYMDLSTSRLLLDLGSGIQLGPGGTPDLRLYRSAAKVLTIDDTAGGAVTLNVINALQVAGVGVSVIGHGPADHADVTRKIWLPAEHAKLDAGTAANIGASPDLTGVIALADAATQGAFWTLMVPADYIASNLNVQPVWSPGAADAVAHTVRWTIVVKAIAAGSTVTAAGTTTAFTGTSAARTAGVVVYDQSQASGVTPSAAGEPVRIQLRRIGADAADTYVGVVNLLGIIVSYSANQ